MARYPIILFGLAALSLAAPPVHAADGAQKIKKCQDAQGRWHYGDVAADACAESKVIEMTGQGIKTKEIAAPPTEAELRERDTRKAEIEQEKRDAEEAERRDKLLLSTYGHEDDIGFVRDRKIADLDAQIAASQDTMKSLTAALERMRKQTGEEAGKSVANTEAQIAKHEAHIQVLRKEQESLRVHYQKELERYRQIKNAAAPPAASP